MMNKFKNKIKCQKKRKRKKVQDEQSSKKLSIMMEKSISKSTIKNIHYIISREGH